MGDPLVSVVIPAHNQGSYVGDAIGSALAQTYSTLEVIVVDDGSTDDTRARLAPYGRQLRCVRQDWMGLSAARNVGIRHANGEWIALLDADDLWHPEKLEVQLRSASRLGEVAMVGSPAASPEMPETLAPEPEARLLEVKDFLSWTPLGPSSALLRRACLEEVGPFDESLTAVEDRDMWLRIAARFPVLRLASPCWSYRRHTAQMSGDPRRMHDNFVRVLHKFFGSHPEHLRLQDMGFAFLHLDACLGFLEVGDRQESFAHLLRSLRRYPWPLAGRRSHALLRTRLLVYFARERVLGRLRRDQ